MLPVYPQPGINIGFMPQNPQMAYQGGTPSNTQEREVENSAQQVLRGAPAMNIKREESCAQCYWTFRDVSYQSQQLGNHKVRRYQLNCINLFCCWPLKQCCCAHTVPPKVSDTDTYNQGISITYPNRYHGVISAKGIVIGSYELEDPALCAFCCYGKQPRVIIKKAVTNEVIIFRPNDSYCQSYLERNWGCCIKSKEMYIEKNGGRVNGRYHRSCLSACLNCCFFNQHFYDHLDIEFTSQIQSDADKLLIYGAFIFFQENVNLSRGCFC